MRILATLALACAGFLFGQPSTAQVPATRVIGEVTGLAAGAGQISLKTDDGETVTVTVGVNTAFRRFPPGAQDLASAARVDFSGIGVGDRVLAIGTSSAGQKKVDARSVIVMSRSDLEQKRQAEHDDWRKRGISGVVSVPECAHLVADSNFGERTRARIAELNRIRRVAAILSVRSRLDRDRPGSGPNRERPPGSAILRIAASDVHAHQR
jgi:hypothetical protein